MIASSPDSCLVSLPLGESLDQNAQVDPAFGAGSLVDAGPGFDAGSLAGVLISGWSLVVVSSVLSLASGVAVSAVVSFPFGVTVVPQKPNHEDVEAVCRSVFTGVVGRCAGVSWDGFGSAS
jgi:hypothetical protein